MIEVLFHEGGRRVFALAVFALWLGGCATTIPTAVQLDAVVMDGDRAATRDELRLVTVQRGAARLETEPGMKLEPGDRIMTGPGATAVIRWPSGSEAHLAPSSRARIGSLFDLVGEVFVRIRARFVVETEFVRAGAEGTSYVVRAVPSSGETLVLVLDGRVTVSSLDSAWAPVRLAPGDKTVTADRPPRLRGSKPPPPAAVPPPVITRATVEELRDTEARSARIARIAETSAARRTSTSNE
jgi:hypothetical protein